MSLSTYLLTALYKCVFVHEVSVAQIEISSVKSTKTRWLADISKEQTVNPTLQRALNTNVS